jgi:thiosulfate reductase cytochrome b subunit
MTFQQFLYLTDIYILMPLLIVTGLFYLYPETAPEKVMGFAGLWPMAMAHYVAGLLGIVFILFHIYISTMGGLRHMITGRERHTLNSSH